MNKVREKLLDFKRRLSDRKMYSVVLVVVAILVAYGVFQYKKTIELRQELDNQYNRAFFDLVGYTNNMETILTKSLLTSSPTKTAGMLQEAWSQANLAQTNLGQLPISQEVLAKTSKFLTQVGDVAFSLNTQTLQGKNMDDPQIKMVEDLYGYAVSLNKSLNELQDQLTTGRLKWQDLSKKGTPFFEKASKDVSAKQFSNIDKNFQDYPILIYDGPYSDNLEAMPPKGLINKDVTEEEAKESVKKFFGEGNITEIKNDGKNDSEPFKTYQFQVLLKGAKKDNYASVSVTQKGGQILWVIYNRDVGTATLDIPAAKQKASEFLKSQGYENMIDTYYMMQDNEATINFEYKQGDVVIYPDLIKVKIAMDNGQIIGFEGKGYLTSHVVRDIVKPKVSEATARKSISSKVKIDSVRMAMIPTKYKTEKYVYEFKGNMNNKNFLIYINADSGVEEDVLLIIDTENGILTM